MQPNTVSPEYEVDRNPLPMWLRWIRTSPELLIGAEQKLLNRLRSTLQTSFVPIFGNTCFIRTLVAQNFPDGPPQGGRARVPMVLMHGFASGLGLWCKNIDSLAAHRPVYAFDLLGFGRSSRPAFSDDAAEAEAQFINSFEEWRSSMDLEKFILVGHSLGGYLSYSYAIAHPNRIAHLILVDPWGFKEAPFDEDAVMQNKKRAWVFRSVRNMLQSSNPLSILRAIGPLGRKAINYVRQDLIRVFDQHPLVSGEFIEVPTEEEEEAARQGFASSADVVADSEITVTGAADQPAATRVPDSSFGDLDKSVDPRDFDGTAALDYVYHINVQRPSGEVGFRALCHHLGWAKRPMLKRVTELDRLVPITFIYGSRSWMDMSSGTTTRILRPDSYVDVKIIEGAGHQVYAQAASEFNAYVNLVAHRVDVGDPFIPFDPMIPNPDTQEPWVHRRPASTTSIPRQRKSSSRLQNFFFPHGPNEPPSVSPEAPVGNPNGPTTSDESSR